MLHRDEFEVRLGEGLCQASEITVTTHQSLVQGAERIIKMVGGKWLAHVDVLTLSPYSDLRLWPGMTRAGNRIVRPQYGCNDAGR